MRSKKGASRSKIPEWEVFRDWSPATLRKVLDKDKTVVFAPGGTSRWYFVYHGDISQGYTQADQFADYAQRSMLRVLEIAAMMFADGIQTVLAAVYVPAMTRRDEEYVKNIAWVYEVMVSDEARQRYDHDHISVQFRGDWDRTLNLVGSIDLSGYFEEVEQSTAGRKHRFIWLTEETEPIPGQLSDMVARELAETGKIPDRASLSTAYYGYPLTQADIFIGHNKPTLGTLVPPLLTVNDLYYTVTPSLSLDRVQWRRILYDHLFSRHSWYRDYRALGENAFRPLLEYYQEHGDIIQGVGKYNPETQIWSPLLNGDDAG
jgi:hypothetical protein